jgi:predicted transcriptional regulator
MSLHPRYAEAILAGTKRVEFRKKAFRRPVNFALLYATKPIGTVIGAFEIQAIRIAPPMLLWDRYGDVGGIARDELEAYYGGTDTGVAIEIGRVWSFRPGLDLLELGLAERPPQSYSYASLGRLVDHARNLQVRSALAEMAPIQLQLQYCHTSVVWTPAIGRRGQLTPEWCPALA